MICTVTQRLLFHSSKADFIKISILNPMFFLKLLSDIKPTNTIRQRLTYGKSILYSYKINAAKILLKQLKVFTEAEKY